jgi:hypothetical protein
MTSLWNHGMRQTIGVIAASGARLGWKRCHVRGSGTINMLPCWYIMDTLFSSSIMTSSGLDQQPNLKSWPSSIAPLGHCHPSWLFLKWARSKSSDTWSSTKSHRSWSSWQIAYECSAETVDPKENKQNKWKMKIKIVETENPFRPYAFITKMG